MEIVAYLLLVLACLILSAFFSGSETALLRIRRRELDQDIEARNGPAALAVREMLQSTSRLLVTILFGNNIVNILGASVASAIAVHLLGPQWGIAVATLVMTITVFVFCEVIPKAIAARHPRRIGYWVALPLYLVHQCLRPLHLIYDRLIDPWVRGIGGTAEVTAFGSHEELMHLARLAPSDKRDGTPIGIIGAAARAAEMTVADIMVPRPEIVAYPIETSPSELLEQVLDEGYTRVPVYEESIDRVLGVVHLKDLVDLVRGKAGELRRIIKPTINVPGRKPILELLTDMQRLFVHLAIVQDEFGVTQGLLTQEDILEELVGEIRDEFDREELQSIRQISQGRYQALGRVKVLDFNRETGESVTAESGDTLAGLAFNTLGRVPRRGESVQVDGYEIVVIDLTRSRINQVQIIVREQPPEHKKVVQIR
jgi:putative hemolysin